MTSSRSWSGQVRLDGAVDVAVDVVGAEASDDVVRSEDRQDVGLDAGEAKGEAVGVREVEDLAELRGTLGVDEVHALEVEHQRIERPTVIGQPAHAVLERLG